MTADEPVAGVPRLCARQAGCARPRGHDDECGPDRDQARVARYAAALSSARLDAVLAVADTELAETRAEVERLEGEYQHVRQLLDADRATLLAVEGALGVCGCQATADVVARRVVAERDALQRQVDAMPATALANQANNVGAAIRSGVLDGTNPVAVAAAIRGTTPEEFAAACALDAVEPADQPHPTPEATRALAGHLAEAAPDLLLAALAEAGALRHTMVTAQNGTWRSLSTPLVRLTSDEVLDLLRERLTQVDS